MDNKLKILTKTVKEIHFEVVDNIVDNNIIKSSYIFVNNIYNDKKVDLTNYILTNFSKSDSSQIKLSNFSYKIRKGQLYVVNFDTSMNSSKFSNQIELKFSQIIFIANKKEYVTSDLDYFLNHIDVLKKESKKENKDNLKVFLNKNNVLKLMSSGKKLTKPIYAVKEHILLYYKGVNSKPQIITDNEIVELYTFSDYINNYSAFVDIKYSYNLDRVKKVADSKLTKAKKAVEDLYQIIYSVEMLESNQISYDSVDYNYFTENDFQKKQECYLSILDCFIIINGRLDKVTINKLHNGIYKCNIDFVKGNYLIKTDSSEIELSSIKNLPGSISLHKTKKSAKKAFSEGLLDIRLVLTDMVVKLKKDYSI